METPRHFVTVPVKGGERYVWRPSPSLRKLGFGEKRLDGDRATAIRQAEQINRVALAERDASAALAMSGSVPSTLHGLMAAYLASPEYLGLRDSTRRGYLQCIELLRQSPLGPSRLKAISPPVVTALKRSMAAAPWQANAVLRVLRLVWAWGRREGFVAGENPAADFRVLKTSPRHVVWRREEEDALLAVAGPEIRLAYLLAIYTAQREGDLLALPWSAYDGGTVSLRQSKTSEVIALPATARLRSTLDATPRRATVILTDARGLPWRADWFRHSFARAMKSAGIKGRRFMDLRRTAIVRLGEAGCTTGEIAAVSGHSIDYAQSILDTYLPRNSAMAAAAILKLEARRSQS